MAAAAASGALPLKETKGPLPDSKVLVSPQSDHKGAAAPAPSLPARQRSDAACDCSLKVALFVGLLIVALGTLAWSASAYPDASSFCKSVSEICTSIATPLNSDAVTLGIFVLTVGCVFVLVPIIVWACWGRANKVKPQPPQAAPASGTPDGKAKEGKGTPQSS